VSKRLQKHKRRARDRYDTPLPAVLPLLRHLQAAPRRTRRELQVLPLLLRRTRLARSLRPAGATMNDQYHEWDDEPIKSNGSAKLGPKFKLIHVRDIHYDPMDDHWLIDGLLPMTGLATIWGKYKSYKSFIAFDVAVAIANQRQTMWGERALLHGPVVYVVGEDMTGFDAGVEAYRREMPDFDDLPLYIIKGRPNLGATVTDRQELIESIAEKLGNINPVAIFLDTLARSRRAFAGPTFRQLPRQSHDPANPANRLAFKLARHFVANAPPPDLVASLAATYTKTRGDLAAVYLTLIASEAAWNPALVKIRSPLEYFVALLRASGERPKPNVVMARLNAMGQPLWNPSGPNGFPDTVDAWASSEGLATRIDVASLVANQTPGRTDPRRFANETLGSLLSPDTQRAISRAETKAQALRLRSSLLNFRGADHGLSPRTFSARRTRRCWRLVLVELHASLCSGGGRPKSTLRRHHPARRARWPNGRATDR
jgi:hypothetical protein